MELFNLDYSRFAMPRTKKKFVDNSKYVMVVKKSRNTVVKYYSLKPLKMTKKPPKSASKKVDKPQLTFLYELFSKMGTAELVDGRKVTSESVSTCAKTCTTDLKLSSVESRMVDSRQFDSDKILSTLRQCIIDKTTIETNNLSAEDANAIEEENEIDSEETPTVEAEDDAMMSNGEFVALDLPSKKSKKKKKKKQGSDEDDFNRDCLEDVWKKGLESIRKENIKDKRDAQKKRFAREKKLMEAIGKVIKDAQKQKRNTRLQNEAEVTDHPDWLKKCHEVSRFH